MFNPAKSAIRFQLTFEGSWPTAVAFIAPRRLVAGNQLGQLLVWDLPEKMPEFKPDPKSDRKAINVWPARQLVGHTNEITRLVATPDGKHLVSASMDRTIRIWPTDADASGTAEIVLDEDTRKREARRQGKKEPAKGSGVSVKTQTACDVLDGHKDWIYALGISADGKRMISGDATSLVIVRDLSTRKLVAQWTGQPWNWIVAASLSPDGTTAFVSENRYKRDDFDIPTPALKTWNVSTAKETLDFLKSHLPKFNASDRTYGASQLWRKFVANGLISTAWSPDGKLVAAAQGGETDTGKVHLFDAASGKLLRTVSGHMSGATDVMFSQDSKYVLSTGRDTSVRICQVADGKEVAVLNSPRGGQFKDWLSSVALSPDENFVAATDIAGLVHVWEFEKA